MQKVEEPITSGVKQQTFSQPKETQKPKEEELIKGDPSTTVLPTISKDNKGKGMSKFWNVITEWF